MRSNNFDERLHRRLVTPRGCEWIRPILTPSNTVPWTHMSQPAKLHLDRFSRFCVHYIKVAQCFSMGRKTPKMPLPPGIWTPI